MEVRMIFGLSPKGSMAEAEAGLGVGIGIGSELNIMILIDNTIDCLKAVFMHLVLGVTFEFSLRFRILEVGIMGFKCPAQIAIDHFRSPREPDHSLFVTMLSWKE